MLTYYLETIDIVIFH